MPIGQCSRRLQLRSRANLDDNTLIRLGALGTFSRKREKGSAAHVAYLSLAPARSIAAEGVLRSASIMRCIKARP